MSGCLIAAPDFYAVDPDPTTPMLVGVSNHCAMWSNAPGTIWTRTTHHQHADDDRQGNAFEPHHSDPPL